MSEQQINFHAAQCQLNGTLVYSSKNDSPVVIMIPGSGPVDRDENSKHLKINFFNTLATHLYESGLCSFRYDKRGVGESQGDYWSTGFYDNIADARAAIAHIEQHPELLGRKIFLLGHSEGAIIATHLAAESSNLAGAIIIAGTARKGQEVLKWQLEKVTQALPRWQKFLIKFLHINLAQSQKKLLDKVKKSSADTLRVKLFSKLNAKWLREFADYDPSIYAHNVLTVPLLAITGEKDLQVPPSDVSSLAEIVSSPIDTKIIPDLTHVLRRDFGTPSISNYLKLVRNPIDPELLSLISTWIKQQQYSVLTQN